MTTTAKQYRTTYSVTGMSNGTWAVCSADGSVSSVLPTEERAAEFAAHLNEEEQIQAPARRYLDCSY